MSDRAQLAGDAKKAIAELERAKVRCRQAGLAAEFVDVDPDHLRMTRAASIAGVKLNDQKTSAGAVRRVAREAAAAISYADAAERAMRKHAS